MPLFIPFSVPSSTRLSVIWQMKEFFLHTLQYTFRWSRLTIPSFFLSNDFWKGNNNVALSILSSVGPRKNDNGSYQQTLYPLRIKRKMYIALNTTEWYIVGNEHSVQYNHFVRLNWYVEFFHYITVYLPTQFLTYLFIYFSEMSLICTCNNITI
jgi:hypothetical protein